MKRPCGCDRCVIDGPCSEGDCRLCWLFHNDQRYKNLWTKPADKRAPRPATVGTELKRLLRELGITDFAGCGCNEHVAQMNAWGIDGCREHFETIRGWIQEAQAKASWATTITATIRAATSGIALQIDPADVAGSLVRLAIERSEPTSLSPSS